MVEDLIIFCEKNSWEASNFSLFLRFCTDDMKAQKNLKDSYFIPTCEFLTAQKETNQYLKCTTGCIIKKKCFHSGSAGTQRAMLCVSVHEAGSLLSVLNNNAPKILFLISVNSPSSMKS